jgi:hypothetical protein
MMITEPAPGRPYAVITGAPGESPLAADRDQLIALYKAHGALLLRGYDLDLPRLRAFTERFCSTSVFNESRGRALLDPQANIQGVAPGMTALPLHSELARTPWKPDICFFACFNPPAEGGETVICDGTELVRALSAPVRDAFATHRLMYERPAPPHELEFWFGTPDPSDAQLAAPPPGCPFHFQRTPDFVLRFFTRPALHTPMFSDAPAFGSFLLFARDHLGNPRLPLLDDFMPVPDAWVDDARAAGDRVKAAVAWQRGDVLMLDNTRFMHGRNAIRDLAERQIASFFGYLDFAIPDSEEIADAPWRRGNFRPPPFA